MKPPCVRLYIGDIHPYLQPDQLKPVGQHYSWRGWIAWERFPTDAGDGPLKLVAITSLVGKQENACSLDPGCLQELAHLFGE